MGVVSREQAELIAQHWLQAFNARRPDQVVEHFTEDVTATSPAILRLRPDSGGTLRGRNNLRDFYEDGMAIVADLHFELVEVLTGIDQLAIIYRNRSQTLVAETLKVRADGQVSEITVTYGESSIGQRSGR